MRVWAAVETETDCPVTVREGRNWLKDLQKDRGFQPLPPEPVRSYPKEPVLTAEELWFRYDREGRDIVQGLSLAVYPGEFLALLGGNGAGKSTALSPVGRAEPPPAGRSEPAGKNGPAAPGPQDAVFEEDCGGGPAGREPGPGGAGAGMCPVRHDRSSEPPPL